MPAMRPGEILDERFRIEREAGAGAMGVVLRAEDLVAGGAVAIKVLRIHGAPSSRFVREAQVLAQLEHPAIVRYVAHGTRSDGTQYLAMEWLDGEELAVRLASGPLPVVDALALARRIADGLSAAHARGIVHRDLKPSNVFLPHGDVRQAKLLDFGIARIQNALAEMTAAGTVIGTPGYMAPEQARGEKGIDARVDVFALGAVLFECLTGRAAFIAENLVALLAKIVVEEPPRVSELREGIPGAIDEVVARLLANSRSDRYADGGAARDAIRSVEALAAAIGDPGAPVRRSAVTRGEQHVVSVVLAAGPIEASRTATTAEERENGDDVALVSQYGARVERLADGAIVATLHGSGAATDQVARAARCALSLRRSMPEATIVLATGRAIFTGRLPIGPMIERAAGLLRAGDRSANESGIRLDDVTAGLLPSRFRVRDGAFGPELTSEEHRADVARTVLGRTTRFVGRDAEMGALGGLYAQVHADSAARAALITGAPGLGKSRLRQELLARLRTSSVVPRVWLGTAEPLGGSAPWALLARVLRDALAFRDDRRTILERVKRRIPESEAMRVATFLSEALGAPLDASPSLPHAVAPLLAARREPPLMTEQVQRAVLDFLRAECAAAPVVIVLEDAHWADPPTMKLVDTALRELDDAPLLVLAFARPEIEQAIGASWTERADLRLSLATLAPRAAERLARDVLGDDADEATVRGLVGRAAGNPFFLEELLRASASDEAGTIPETLLAIVQKRLEALDDDSRRVLRAASVYGGVFWGRSPAALLGGDRAVDVEAQLARLVDREIVVEHPESRLPGETEYAFRHAIVRDAAYEMLTDADRITAHRFAAEWLERAGEPSRALLADHFERGNDPRRAARCYVQAAAQALHADDLDGCMRLAKRGFALTTDDDEDDDLRGELHLVRAEAHHWRAEFRDARGESLDAVHLLPQGSESWSSAAAIAVAACATLGETDEANGVASDLASFGDASRPSFLVAVAQCVAFLPLGKTSDALSALLPDASVPGNDALLAARIHVARASRAHAMGDPVRALDEFGRAADEFDRAGHRRGARAARGNAGFACTELGRHEDAERILRATLEEARAAGALGTVAWCAMHLGIVLGRLDRTSEALALEGEAAELAKKQGNKGLEADVAIATSDVFLKTGAADLAAEHAIRARLTADTPALKAAAAGALARARLVMGQAANARAAAQEALEIVDTNAGAEDVELAVRLAHAEALHADGDLDGAKCALAIAKRSLEARAAAIADGPMRSTFLERVPVNARILQLDRAWSGANP